MQSSLRFLCQFWPNLARNAEPFSASCVQVSIKGKQGDYLRAVDDEMSLKEKNKPSKNAWAQWLKSETISIVMEALKNKAFGGSGAGVDYISPCSIFLS